LGLQCDYQLPATSNRPPATSNRPPATGHRQQATSHYQLFGGEMSNSVLEEFERLQAEMLANARKYNEWSRIIALEMIEEIEAKLLASDLPVDDDEDEDLFWE
jgi:hypothetical protein